jgi:putative peptidoglycan lipid II flippase
MVKSWARSPHLLTSISLLSSAAGFLSQVVLAKTFGISTAVDAYFFAIGAPVFLGGLMAGAINFFLTPHLRQLHHGTAVHGSALSTDSVVRLGLLLNVLTACFALVGMPLQYLTLPATSPINAQPELPWLLAGGWLFAGGMVHQSVMAALLASRDQLAHAAAIPLFPPICSALLVSVAGERLGVASMLGGQVVGSFASIVYAAVLCPHTSDSATREPVGPLVRLVVTGLPSAAIAMACFSAYPLIDSVLGPRAGNNVMSQISYAQRVIIGLGTLLVAAPLAMATNQFADIARYGNMSAFLQRYRRIVGLSLGPVAALTCGLIFAGEFIVGMLFGRGKFSVEEVHTVGVATAYMAPGMLLMLLTSLTFRAAFALRGGSRAFSCIGVIWVMSYSLLGAHLLSRGVIGLAISYSVSWVLASSLAWLFLHRCAALHFDGRGSHP